RLFRTDPDDLRDTPSTIIRQGCRRLAQLFGSLDVLQTERRSAARKFLETEQGKKVLDQQLALEVSRRAQSLEDEVKKRRSELAAEEQRLADRLEEFQQQRQAREQARAAEMKGLEQEKTRLEEMLEKLHTQIQLGVEELAH